MPRSARIPNSILVRLLAEQLDQAVIRGEVPHDLTKILRGERRFVLADHRTSCQAILGGMRVQPLRERGCRGVGGAGRGHGEVHLRELGHLAPEGAERGGGGGTEESYVVEEDLGEDVCVSRKMWRTSFGSARRLEVSCDVACSYPRLTYLRNLFIPSQSLLCKSDRDGEQTLHRVLHAHASGEGGDEGGVLENGEGGAGGLVAEEVGG